MSRYFCWDYRKPYYYMVTLKCLPNRPPLAILDATDRYGFKRNYPLTQCLQTVLHAYCESAPGVESIAPYAIMPDHIHILLKIADIPERKSLMDLVDLLQRLLRNAFQNHTGLRIPLFEPEWHDLIVKRKKQLPNFQNYILNNPKMALLRRNHREHFYCYRAYTHTRFGGIPYDIIGNPELLDEPAFLAVRLSRSIQPNTPEWLKMEAFFGAWKPGGTAIGTWRSPAERRAYQLILEKEGNLIVLSPDGFPHLWHPEGEEAQTLCAKGRLLYASPYPPHSAKLPIGETRARCLSLNEAAARTADP